MPDNCTKLFLKPTEY